MNKQFSLTKFLLFCTYLLSYSLTGQVTIASADSILALPDDTAKVRALNTVVKLMARNNHPDLLTTLNKGKEIATSLQDNQGLGDFHLGLSYALFNAGDFPTASSHTRLALHHFLAAGNTTMANRLRYEMAVDNFYAGNYDTASTQALEVLRAYVETDYRVGIVRINTLLSQITRELNDLKKAEAYDLEAVRIAREAGGDIDITRAAANLAQTLFLQERYDEALPLATEAVNLAANKFAYPEYTALGVRGTVYVETGRYREALADYERMAEIAGEETDVTTLVQIAELYQLTGRWKEARALLHQANNIFLSQGVSSGRRLKINLLLQADELSPAQLDTMRFYQAAAARIQDTLQRVANEATLLDLETQYKTAEKEAEIALQKTELSQQRRFLLFTVGGLLLALSAGIVFYVLSRRLRRKNAENEKLVAEKETLIGEIHHRVKNNLQVISSLLQLQSRGLDADDQQAKDALRESQSRVQAMGLIHQKLYQGDEVTSVRMPEYLHELGETLLDAYRLDDRVEIYYDVEDISLDVDTAIPLGLIINELVTNSLKYAFPDGREGTIEIALFREDKDLTLKVSDDGVGAAADEVAEGGTGFGTNLVELLNQKLRGRKRRLPGGGFGTEIVFPT